MDKARRRRSLGRLTVLTLVVGGHVLLVMLFASSRPGGTRASSGAEAVDVIVLLNLTPEPEPATVAEAPQVELASASAGVIGTPPDVLDEERVKEDRAAIADPGADSSGSASTELPPDNAIIDRSATIDWQGEAALTAEAMAPGLVRKQLQECEEAKRHGRYPPGCKKPASEYEPDWTPEPKRAGFAPFPYVRLGKRCVVALGFFGCTLGKLPDADGSVFEDMHDTNRPQSSVPEVEASVFPERPAPQVLKGR